MTVLLYFVLLLIGLFVCSRFVFVCLVLVLACLLFSCCDLMFGWWLFVFGFACLICDLVNSVV